MANINIRLGKNFTDEIQPIVTDLIHIIKEDSTWY